MIGALQLKSPIRWAGGKSKLAEKLAAEIEATSPKRYIEPFVGGGAVALAISPSIPKTLSDSNHVLMSMWLCLKSDPEALINELTAIEKQYKDSPLGYLAARDELNQIIRQHPMKLHWRRRAALFLYLNARSFNGLWRVNESGLYNVPFGKIEKPSSIDYIEAKLLSVHLQNVTITTTDYRQALRVCSLMGAAIFVDSPYDAMFGDYTKDGFSAEDQCALAKELQRVVTCGAKVWATNNDTELVRSIYSWASIEPLEEWHGIGAKGARRGKRNCVLIRG